MLEPIISRPNVQFNTSSVVVEKLWQEMGWWHKICQVDGSIKKDWYCKKVFKIWLSLGLSGLGVDHLFFAVSVFGCFVVCVACFDSSPRAHCQRVYSPPPLFLCSLALIVSHQVLVISLAFPFIAPRVSLSFVRLLCFSQYSDCHSLFNVKYLPCLVSFRLQCS